MRGWHAKYRARIQALEVENEAQRVVIRDFMDRNRVLRAELEKWKVRASGAMR